MADLQKALDPYSTLLTQMKISLAKTHFLAVRGTPAERYRIHLTIEGVPLQPAPQDCVRVLGVPVHQSGGATEWIK